MMEIRSTEIKDLPLVMEIYDYARAFMRATGILLNGLTVILLKY
mgnify:CR=1 FL=1